VELASTKHRFCPQHADEHGKQCCIVGCTRPARDNHLTCDEEDHQQIEEVHTQRTRAAFQLRHRMERAQVAHPRSSQAVEANLSDLVAEEEVPEETYEILGGQAYPSQPDHVPTQRAAAFQSINDANHGPQQPAASSGNSRKLRAKFGRTRTHNEQILVAPCGVIIARETFFNAKAIPSIAASVFSFINLTLQ
jgi:hypothetical protein